MVANHHDRLEEQIAEIYKTAGNKEEALKYDTNAKLETAEREHIQRMMDINANITDPTQRNAATVKSAETLARQIIDIEANQGFSVGQDQISGRHQRYH